MALSRYSDVSSFEGWELAPEYLRRAINTCQARSLLEIGCGPNPTLSRAGLPDEFRYVISDFDAGELSKAPPGYEQVVLDASSDIPVNLFSAFDIVFSRMVNEHVKNGRSYHENILRMLRPGGVAIHCSASLGALPFFVNRWVPETMSDWLMDIFAPRDRFKHDKFPAYYSWCRGPTRKMISAFQSAGYEVISYDGYFGHNYYRNRLAWINSLERLKTDLLLKHPIPYLCSYVTVVLRKPASD